MGLRGVKLDLDGDRFSDLFFNFDHPHYIRLMDEPNTVNSLETVRAALKQDASEFCFLCNLDPHDEVLLDELVDDFLDRL